MRPIANSNRTVCMHSLISEVVSYLGGKSFNMVHKKAFAEVEQALLNG